VRREGEKDKRTSKNANPEADCGDIDAKKSQREAMDDNSVNEGDGCCSSDGDDERYDCKEPT